MHIKSKLTSGLFSFKNSQLMSRTDSYIVRRVLLVLSPYVNLNVDLKVAGTLRVPSALHLGWTAHGVCLLLCIRISLYENVKNIPEKSRTK